MTPAARIQTAAEVLDSILGGVPAEQALTRWARASRFAGAKDRAAIRDHVFDALRRKSSYGALGGGDTGRALMIGALRAEGIDPATMFTGVGHAPTPLSPEEVDAGRMPSVDKARDMPDWIWQELHRSLGEDAESEAHLLRDRAPVCLRVNMLKSNVEAAIFALGQDGVTASPHSLSPTALLVTEGARRIHLSSAYINGLVELQDAASQAVVDLLPLQSTTSVLDYCAGGGGKSLAMAARTGGAIVAHDSDVARMKDIAVRSQRAGADIRTTSKPKGVFDLVLCDSPCSGSGSWRRAPEAKWRITPERLGVLNDIQDQILDKAQGFAAPGGVLAYATCSLFAQENHARADAFVQRHPSWRISLQRQFLLRDGGDGFFLALFHRD